MRGTTLQTPRSVKKEGEEVLQAPEQREIPLQPVVKTMVRQAVPLQPMEVHGGADIHLQPVEAVTPWEARAGAGSWQDLWPRGPVERGAHAEAGLLAGLVTPWGTHAGAVCS